MAELVTACAPAQVSALGLTGMLPTLVTLGSNGEPTGPAITWEDSRAERFGPACRDPREAQRLYESTGQWVDGRYLVPMFRRLAEEEPERAAATRAICSAKDFLFFHLTGELVTDPSTAAGSGCYVIDEGDYDSATLERAAALMGRALPQLPPVISSTSVRTMPETLAADIGLRDVQVCLGAADSVLGAHGVGAVEPGTVAHLSGTSTVMLAPVERFVRDPLHRFLVTPAIEEGRFALEMDLLSTGSAVAWATELIGKGLTEREFLERGAALDPREAPVFLPYLAGGEQGGLWDPNLAGSVLGLELHHGPTQIVRALLTGIVLESKRCVDVLRANSDAPLEVLAAGWPAEVPAFRQDLADALGAPVRAPMPTAAGASARGAALLAAASRGVKVPNAPRQDEKSAPSIERAELWEGLWDRHDDARKTLSLLYRGWSNRSDNCRGTRTGAQGGSHRGAPC